MERGEREGSGTSLISNGVQAGVSALLQADRGGPPSKSVAGQKGSKRRREDKKDY